MHQTNAANFNTQKNFNHITLILSCVALVAKLTSYMS